jgi:putative addiction module component (TIGR02574 family)
MLLADFRDLSIPYRLELIEEIWDSIALDTDDTNDTDGANDVVLSEAQKQRLDERVKVLKRLSD